MAELTAKQLRELLRYDSESGVFRWLIGGHGKHVGDIAGHIQANGARQIKVGSHSNMAHRLAWLYMAGEWPKMELDHKNTVRSDNRWVNIRAATRRQNQGNVHVRSDNKSGIKGIWWDSGRGKWVVRIVGADGKRRQLGRYNTKAGASIAYARAARAAFGEFAWA